MFRNFLKLFTVLLWRIRLENSKSKREFLHQKSIRVWVFLSKGLLIATQTRLANNWKMQNATFRKKYAPAETYNKQNETIMLGQGTISKARDPWTVSTIQELLFKIRKSFTWRSKLSVLEYKVICDSRRYLILLMRIASHSLSLIQFKVYVRCIWT